MATLSLAMIVKDEARHLGHCLASVKDLVDEMVIVDTGSSDDTVAIARTFGARVPFFPWRHDFAAARNESLRHCTGDWVLILDADEAVDACDHPVIRRALDRDRPPAYNLTLRSYVRDGESIFLGQAVTPNESGYHEGSSHPFYGDAPGLRLCRRFPDLAYRGRIHELLTPYFAERRLPVGPLEAVIHHFGKVDDDREAAKAVYYLQLAQEEARRQPRSPQAHFNLMTQASIAGDWGLAQAAATAFTRLQRSVPAPVLATLAMAHLHQDRPAEALPHLQRLLKEHPGHPLASRQLPRALLALGRTDEARANLLQGLQSGPRDEALRNQLIALDLHCQQPAQAAADAWEALKALPSGGDGHWHALVAAFLMQAGQLQQGRAVLDLGLRLHPAHEGLLRLAKTGTAEKA
ncbi:MAG: glycosyltransferase [Geothrix sp.]|nr:glycosyltransferase [Geothrix sp.]